jgi:hypothetical protein
VPLAPLTALFSSFVFFDGVAPSEVYPLAGGHHFIPIYPLAILYHKKRFFALSLHTSTQRNVFAQSAELVFSVPPNIPVISPAQKNLTLSLPHDKQAVLTSFSAILKVPGRGKIPR